MYRLATLGHQGYDIFTGEQTVGGAAGTFVAEGVIGFVGGKLIKGFGKVSAHVYAKIAARLAQRRAGKLSRVNMNHVLHEIESLRGLKASSSQHGTEALAWKISRESRAQGLKKLKARPDGQTLDLSHNVGDGAAFNRKAGALKDLADRGKLRKSTSVRNESVTIKYRKALLDRAEKQWGATDPAKADRMEKLIKSMHADHVHELQLGGLDHHSSLSMLDKSVNTSVGSQIRHQLAKIPEGASITGVNIIEKGLK